MSEPTGQWGPDPYGRAELRWYDGNAWTRHVSTGGVTSQEPDQQAVVPPVAQPVAQATTPLPGYPQTPYGQPGYQPPSIYSGVSVHPPGRGRLIAAGVMSIISGAVTLVIGVYLLVVATSNVGQIIDYLSGNALTLMAIVCLVLGGVFLWFGIVGVMAKPWSRLAIAIASGLSLLLVLLALIDDPDSAAIVPITWFGTILGLAVSYDPKAAPQPQGR